MRAACLCAGLWMVGHVKVALGLASVLAAIVYHRIRSRVPQGDLPHVEAHAAEVHSRVQQIEIERGAAMAHAVVMKTYAEEIKALDTQEMQTAETLLQKPDELARYLVRVSGTQKAPLP